MSVQLSNPTVTVNNNVVAIAPNTLKYTDGKGEYSIRAASAGGQSVDQVFSQNVETQFSMVSFELPATVENIALVREWKSNLNQNLVQVSGSTPEGNVTRTFNQAAIINEPEIALGADTNISVEFRANQAV